MGMKRIHTLLLVFMAQGFIFLHAQEPMERVVDRGLSRAKAQAMTMATALEGTKDALPRTFEGGKLVTCKYNSWVSGFFPGVLWQLYEHYGEERLRHYADLYTARVEPAKRLTNTHDLGFMLYCSFGHGHRLTGNAHYQRVIEEGTASLLTRWRPRLGVIRSWDFNKKWQYPVIIDNMMNLEMLCYMTKKTGDRSFEKVACKHAETTMKNHFREDYSTFHVVSYDTISGKPHAKNTHQGYADASAWARGQTWGLYGYTMMYRETGRKAFLNQARKIAAFLVNHPNLPADKVPYWDFNAPDIPNAKRDASAAAIMASALIELSQLDPSKDAALWLATAQEQIRTLTSDAYLAKEGANGGFILMHGVGHLPGKSEVDVPLTYADYYYVEALLRMKKLLGRTDGVADRREWVESMLTIASPVLSNLAEGTLKKNMPFESLSEDTMRREVSYLEAVGRTVCGIAPWLELGPDDTPEGQLRQTYIRMVADGIRNAVDPASADFLMFDKRHAQPLVDAAFLAEGVLRAPTQIWGNLDKQTRKNLISAWKTSRQIRAYESNWLLFASIVEAALLEFSGEYDAERLYKGIRRFRDEWYKGDAWYGDGADFHLDYYNSLVIHPMLTEMLRVMKKHNLEESDFLARQEQRHSRFAAQLERMVSPEGTYPVIGRSIAYRFGAFHALASASLLHLLPEQVNPAQVRCALTSVMQRQLAMPGTFDKDGWLRVGFAGNQTNMSETYINTGSLYLCMAAFLPLGLPSTDPFWANPAVDWTSRRAWNGQDVGADRALKQ